LKDQSSLIQFSLGKRERIERSHFFRREVNIVKGIIFNIQRYSVDDGPGIRSTVFIKGCPLRCLWCSNPESQKPWSEVAHSDSVCNKCGRCKEVCDTKAISVDDDGVHINRKRCTNCGKCVEVCVPGALKVFGNEISVEETFKEIQKDIQYYQTSGGGVTASGGEPLYQADFVAALFKRCQNEGIHTCLDTCGYATTAAVEKVLLYTSLVLFDLKCMDPITHRKLTGCSNKLINRNFELIVASGKPLIIRVPIIPGFNDSDEEITAIARTLVDINCLNQVNLLPYHKFGTGKYKMLDRRYKLGELVPPTDAKLRRAKEIFKSAGINCEIRK
jgi:pyruvate formate lyase activating enzyme